MWTVIGDSIAAGQTTLGKARDSIAVGKSPLNGLIDDWRVTPTSNSRQCQSITSSGPLLGKAVFLATERTDKRLDIDLWNKGDQRMRH